MMCRAFASCLVALFCSASGLSQEIPLLVSQQGHADIILTSGKIVTMDDRSNIPNIPGHIVEAMAIKGKTIMALGTNGEMRRLAGPETRFVELDHRTVIPGLIATHFHLYGNAARRYGPGQGLTDPSIKLTVTAENTAEATAKKLRDTLINAIQVQNIPKGQWITVNLLEGKDNPIGTTFTWVYLGNINRRQWDSATPDNPVAVKTGGTHPLFNKAAMEAFIELFPDFEESVDLENGPGSALDGYVGVPGVDALSWEFWWKDQPIEKLSETLRLFGMDLQKLGITTVATRIVSPRIVAAYNRLNRSGGMPHRLAYYIESQRGQHFGLRFTREFYKAAGAPWTDHVNGGEMLWLNGMCNEIWDSIYNEVCLGSDVSAPPEIKARERCPAPGSKPWESYKAAILSGWRPVQAHGTSSHGARLYIQMLEEAMKEGNYSLEYMRNLRTTMEHSFFLGNVPDVMAGIKKYGIIINVTPSHLARVPDVLDAYGEKLRPFTMPVKTWIHDGHRVTFEANGSDFWSPIYTLMTRRIKKQGTDEWVELLPEEGIDRVTALKMVTTWASEYMLAEDTIGTLEPGKYADFVVLEKDFFTIPTEEILDGIPVV
ncbi:amidohydrolase family protein, partial [Acidobacteria bacterium AH-259-D05]|nr:amidohydrolase family protein [Acidobacteria bacterium AH-259-D05]